MDPTSVGADVVSGDRFQELAMRRDFERLIAEFRQKGLSSSEIENVLKTLIAELEAKIERRKNQSSRRRQS
jgi:hypothetical protein